MKTLLTKHKVYILLALIIALGIFFRTFKIMDTFGFGHDADLSSWIVKDILVDKHIRTIGQETSTPGIFIGPLYYYFLTPFYLITNFHPASAILAAVTVGIATILSYYFVFRKLFDQTTGLIAAFMQAVLHTRVAFDRWVVPTVTVNLWCIWYFFAIFKIYQGNLNYLGLAGLLSGLIWHTHVALAPLLILIPLSVIFSKKFPNFKQISYFLAGFILPMVPYLIFEIRHGFTQTTSFFQSFLLEPANVYGDDKFDDVLRQSLGDNYFLNFSLLIALLFLPKLKVLSYKMVILILVWIVSVIGFFTFSKKLISEYYFENVKTIILILAIIFLSILIKSKNKLLKFLGFGVLFFVFCYSLYYLYQLSPPSNSYLVRNEVVNYIKNDSTAKQFPCVAISHISTPGENFGYRYLFWYRGLKISEQKENIPVYTIVFPNHLATSSSMFTYGGNNVIPPEKEYNWEQVAQSCPGEDFNLVDSFWGFTK